jgi:hypothetical protein
MYLLPDIAKYNIVNLFNKPKRKWLHQRNNWDFYTKVRPRQLVTERWADVVSRCNAQFYPNISTVLQLLLSLPVGSCSCERSFSSLRHLNTWSRTCMGESRQNGLAVLYVHKHHTVIQQLQPKTVLRQLDSTGHRRTSLAFTDSKELLEDNVQI